MIWEPVKEDREKAERIALFRHGIIYLPFFIEREEGQNKYFKKALRTRTLCSGSRIEKNILFQPSNPGYQLIVKRVTWG